MTPFDMKPQLSRGLYAITPAGISTQADGLARVEAVLSGGAALIQYRDELADHKEKLVFGRRLAGLCRTWSAPLIINDDPQLAKDCGAQGVHLGRDDGPAARARTLLGDAGLIGLSCYNDPSRVRLALESGCDYVAMGSVFASATKPAAAHCPLSLISKIKQETPLPLVAIGGISVDNGASVVAAGADYLAVIGGLFVPGEEQHRARQLSDLFLQTRTVANEQ